MEQVLPLVYANKLELDIAGTIRVYRRIVWNQYVCTQETFMHECGKNEEINLQVFSLCVSACICKC